MPDGKVSPDNFRGWLLKWTNYLKGYQRRWCVLNSGILAYYRTQAEMAHTCRGTINLAGALIDTIDSHNFAISNGGTQVYYLRASSEVERNRWVTALELAKAKARKTHESDLQSSVTWEEIGGAIGEEDPEHLQQQLAIKLDALITCNELVTKHAHALQRQLSDLEQDQLDASPELKQAHEKALLFKISSSTMLGACSDFMGLAQVQEHRWLQALQQERSKRQQLELTVETLAKQHNILEQAVERRAHPLSRTSSENSVEGLGSGVTAMLAEDERAAMQDDDDDSDLEFFDAEETAEGAPVLGHQSPRASVGEASSAAGESSTTCQRAEAGAILSWPTLPPRGNGPKYRTSIPPKPLHRMNLWSIMKNCIGRELSKIPMPVNFNEPLSFLQKLCEVDLEYSSILDRAAQCQDSLEQLALIACFTVSSCSSTFYRTGKPFNPLLGETFEFDRTADLGWRCLCEQVSHHPPSTAMDCVSSEWHLYQDYTMTSKFRGKYLQILPHGTAHLIFRKTGHHYTWRKVSSTVHNIIVGKLWVDQSGEVEIINHTTNERCQLKYTPYSYFSSATPRKVYGVVLDRNRDHRMVLSGTWESRMEYRPILSVQPTGGPGVTNNVPTVKYGRPVVGWEVNPPLAGQEAMYGFSLMACACNQLDGSVAPTDSRRRPDQRLMEAGNFDEANSVKLQLEERQRERRRQREAQIASLSGAERNDAEYKPRWFNVEKDPLTGQAIYKYSGGYWEAKASDNWTGLVDIYNTQPASKE